mmetsp:Transcript_20589/g.45981  ORF Transcript_20589/g.45981 Transcript_20589/m.45981 type:complete len:242 (+) Transcript_20589:594-1319(+)
MAFASQPLQPAACLQPSRWWHSHCPCHITHLTGPVAEDQGACAFDQLAVAVGVAELERVVCHRKLDRSLLTSGEPHTLKVHKGFDRDREAGGPADSSPGRVEHHHDLVALPRPGVRHIASHIATAGARLRACHLEGRVAQARAVFEERFSFVELVGAADPTAHIIVRHHLLTRKTVRVHGHWQLAPAVFAPKEQRGEGGCLLCRVKGLHNGVRWLYECVNGQRSTVAHHHHRRLTELEDRF